MNHHLLLIIHLICATVWVGGHLYLSFCILPAVLRKNNPRPLLVFEKNYAPLGMTALVLLVITGIGMTLEFGIKPKDWFSFSSPIEKVTSTKLLLLFSTVLFALSAQLRIIPKLRTHPGKLWEMAVHVICVTLIGIAMLVLGSFVRYGGL